MQDNEIKTIYAKRDIVIKFNSMLHKSAKLWVTKKFTHKFTQILNEL